MTIVTSTAWQLVCPVTDAAGAIGTTTRPLPATFTAPGTRVAALIPTVQMSAIASMVTPPPGGTIVPGDTFIPGDPLARATIALHTTLLVDIFPNPVPNPIQTYRPAWESTGDGSLITPIYRDAAMREHARMILAGFLLCVFLRNVFVSIDYLRRGKAKDKTLFYILLASQLWGPVAFISIIVGMMEDHVSCKP